MRQSAFSVEAELLRLTHSLETHASMPPVSGTARAAHWRDGKRERDREREREKEGADRKEEGRMSSKHHDRRRGDIW